MSRPACRWMSSRGVTTAESLVIAGVTVAVVLAVAVPFRSSIGQAASTLGGCVVKAVGGDFSACGGGGAQASAAPAASVPAATPPQSPALNPNTGLVVSPMQGGCESGGTSVARKGVDADTDAGGSGGCSPSPPARPPRTMGDRFSDWWNNRPPGGPKPPEPPPEDPQCADLRSRAASMTAEANANRGYVEAAANSLAQATALVERLARLQLMATMAAQNDAEVKRAVEDYYRLMEGGRSLSPGEQARTMAEYRKDPEAYVNVLASAAQAAKKALTQQHQEALHNLQSFETALARLTASMQQLGCR